MENNEQNLHGFLFKNDIIEQVFHFICTKTETRGRKPSKIDDYIKKYDETFEVLKAQNINFKTVYITNISHCLKSLSVEMAKDINNHLKYNFERMFKRFLYIQNLSVNGFKSSLQ
jgi:hypothetical protein